MSAGPPPGGVLRALGAHAPVGLALSDRRWRVLACNPALTDITGRPVEAIVGRSLGALMSPAARVLVQSRYAGALVLDGQVDELAIDLLHVEEGRRVPVLLHARTVDDPDVPEAAHLTALTPAVDRRSYERDLLAARQRAEASERELGRLNRAAHRLAVARSRADVDAALAAHRAEAAAEGGGGPTEQEAVAVVVDQALDRIHLVARLEAEARTDPLTGLANRRAFDELLDRVLRERRRTGRAVTLLVVDLDDFKAVNDRHGHLAGDRLLVEVAVALRGAVRGEDMVARLGGDEFAVLTQAPATRAAAAAMRERVHACSSEAVAHLGAGASVGLVHLPADAPTPDRSTLLADADAAMYRRKADR